MRSRAALAAPVLAAAAATAAAAPGSRADRPLAADRDDREVIGGADAPSGKYPDVVGVVFEYGGTATIDCTGTLIAPELVLTAGHCVDASLTEVVIGSVSRSRRDGAEVIPVAERFEHPSSWSTYDVAVLRLARPSTRPPRTIARGWASLDIIDGATASIVGFGAVDAGGVHVVDALQEAMTTITDATCTRTPGCNAGARPAGELGAGGGGIDTCPGDSGGPLYLVTDYGTLLAGVTSRAYADATRTCSEGGIYVRADAVVDWIEARTGIRLPAGASPVAPPLRAVPGGVAMTTILPNDPRGAAHTFRIARPPAHGVAEVDAAGRVIYRAGDDHPGADALEIEIVDGTDPSRAVALRVAVEIGDDAAGCCSAAGGTPGGGVAVVALVVGAARRRRRAPRRATFRA